MQIIAYSKGRTAQPDKELMNVHDMLEEVLEDDDYVRTKLPKGLVDATTVAELRVCPIVAARAS